MTRREIWLAAALFAAVTLVLTYPIALDPSRTSLGSDADGTFTWTLAFSENLIGSAFFAAPVLWLTGNPVFAMNAVALLSVAFAPTAALVLYTAIALIAIAFSAGPPLSVWPYLYWSPFSFLMTSEPLRFTGGAFRVRLDGDDRKYSGRFGRG